MLVLVCIYLGFIWLLVVFYVGCTVDLDRCSSMGLLFCVCLAFMLLLCRRLCGCYVASTCVYGVFFVGSSLGFMWVLCWVLCVSYSVFWGAHVGFMLHRCWLDLASMLALCVFCLIVCVWSYCLVLIVFALG